MMNVMLRRTASMAASRATLAALASLDALSHRLIHFSSADAAAADAAQVRSFPSVSRQKEIGLGNLGARDFHCESRVLDFWATTPVSQPGYAVADYYDEEKSPKASAAADEGLEIAKLGIAQEIVSALAKRGITKLFPIQRAVLEPAMQGRDMIGRARTGTGKTLAFGIPILDKIIQYKAKHRAGRNPLALVLAPTRELARQVDREFYDSAPNLNTICVYGGTPILRQINELDYGVDIVVGTPGRIIDLLKRGALNLSEVQFVVLDEADQMLNVGFEEDVEVILDKLPRNRQSLMFSATMPTWIRRLTMKYLKDPLTIDLVGDSDQKLAEGITLYSVASDIYGKPAIIGPLITEHANGGKCIVFTQTKRDADRLAYAMARKYGCEALHGDISQNQRERTLMGFREGRFNILVATDVAARGLDIPNVDLVIHYELPNSSEIFVHRSGRTGRAGKKGRAILIYSDEQARTVRNIEREVGCKFTELPRIAVDGGDREMLADMGGGVRSGPYGGMGNNRLGNSGFGRSGGRFGGSGYGRSGGYGNSSSGYGESSSNRYGSFGGPSSGRSGGGYGGSSSSRSSGFGGSNFGRSSGFGNFGSSDRSGGFGNFGSSDRSSGFGNGRSSGFGDSNPSQSGGLGGNSSSRFGSFGDSKVDNDRNSGSLFSRR